MFDYSALLTKDIEKTKLNQTQQQNDSKTVKRIRKMVHGGTDEVKQPQSA